MIGLKNFFHAERSFKMNIERYSSHTGGGTTFSVCDCAGGWPWESDGVSDT